MNLNPNIVMPRKDKLLPCPFYKVDKEIGHNPYTVDAGGLWYVKCTCGARGPISPVEDWAIKAWNTRASEVVK